MDLFLECKIGSTLEKSNTVSHKINRIKKKNISIDSGKKNGQNSKSIHDNNS